MLENISESPSNVKEKTQSLGWAIFLSIFLVFLKGFAGFFCASASLLASALDSLMDMGISSVNYLSVKLASQPPDSDHAYGHEKIESLASYTQGVLFLFFSFFIFWESFQHVRSRIFLTHSNFALSIIGISASVNLMITFIMGRIEKKTGSLIMKAEKTHYLMDILSYIMIFVSILLVKWTGWFAWDILGGILVAGYIAFLSFQILLQAANELVDRSLPKRMVDELDRMIRHHDPHVLGYHELRTRKVGEKSFVDFHLVLKRDQSFENVHEITESLVQKIQGRFRNADVTIHEDPEHGK
ncbi:MAG: cation transporter [Chlamydiae bacterium]|nr:cation transporter [Chlamydiota bacterium]MBI3277618.1 cation transporter [Chlamydiota bacterium]